MSARLPAPRRRVRTPFRVEILSRLDDTLRFLGYGSDVSETGLFVQCSNPRAEGTRLQLRLHLPGARPGSVRGDPIGGEAGVVWARRCRGRNHATSGMGIQLARLDMGAAIMLQEFCRAEDPCRERALVLERIPPLIAPARDVWQRLRTWLAERAGRFSGRWTPIAGGRLARAFGKETLRTPEAAPAQDSAGRFRAFARSGSHHRQLVVTAASPEEARAEADRATGEGWEIVEVDALPPSRAKPG